ncbi:MAG: hypothetical protein IT577_03990 [Verrucomicrobiae bacterium]|nr:hypothetical protein [Verrucomicrobiae bacterium]
MKFLAVPAALLLGALPSTSAPTLELSIPAEKPADSTNPDALKYDAREWYGSTFWTGPDWTRVGKDWHHPGQDTPSVRRFACPQDGTVTISGKVFKRHLAGDGIVARILHGDREIWKAQIAGADADGKSHDLTLAVRKGDSLRFVVEKFKTIACDTTAWDPTITYRDGPAFTASAAFAARTQGAAGWHYEMISSGLTPKAAAAMVRAFAQDLSLIDAPLPARLTQADALPLAIIASNHIIAFDPSAPFALSVASGPGGATQVRASSDAATPIWHAEFRGPWANGLIALDAALRSGDAPPALRKLLGNALARTGTSLPLWAMVQEDWIRQDHIDGSGARFFAAATNHIARARAILEGLRHAPGTPGLNSETSGLSRLTTQCAQPTAAPAAARALWIDARILKRRILLAHPLLDFEELLVCKRAMPSWSHLVAQYFGWRQRSGGGLYALRHPGHSLELRDVVGGRLPEGSYLEPRLSHDAERVLFAFVACDKTTPAPTSLAVNEAGPAERYYHLYEVPVSGGAPRQLTDGPYDDMMGEYLPDGGIVFCSSRRKGYSRCFGPEYSPRWDTYTLHRMDADGANIRTLSQNDVSEWFPAISHAGQILFARWDYIDRDAVTHQNLWACRPDGTNPFAVWGNALPKPHCTFQAKPIPGSRKIVFTAAAHHAITAGPVCLLDPALGPNNPDAVERITPMPFPEAEGAIKEWYESPWPLSESLFLVAHSPLPLRMQGEHAREPNADNALGICLLDRHGNRELLYRDPDISTTTPIPIAARPRPPVIPSLLPKDPPPHGEMFITDVYQGLEGVPRGSIAAIRIVQLFPKTTPVANQPRIGLAGEENARAILGTVPVEADGSARFLVPANKKILFQAIDRDGFARRTMRSSTYVQPGEVTSCVGCHEYGTTTHLPRAAQTLAMGRPPSRIEPGTLGGRPFSFVEIVQPVLDRHCVSCHGGQKTEAKIDLTGQPTNGFTRSYWTLCGSADSWHDRRSQPERDAEDLVPRYRQRNQIQITPPDDIRSARRSRLMRHLLEGDGHQDVKLSDDDVRRIAAWIDLNAIFYGSYDPGQQAAQLAGQPIPMPEIQ